MSTAEAPTRQQTNAKVDGDAFASVVKAGYDAIPLHTWNSKSRDRQGRTRKDGKRPLDFNWTTKDYDSLQVQKRCAAEHRNMGIRLRADDLVIDVDPRNGGDDGIAALVIDLGLDLSQAPRTATGTDGSHYFFKKPRGVSIVGSLESYRGVEFKSKGQQVVAAGSIHPESGRRYEFDLISHPPLEDAPEAPPELIDAIRRPERVGAPCEAGAYSQEQIARALDSIDVSEFRDHDKWLRMAMAAHHASNGDARHEFIEWSTSDPRYADAAAIIGRRWDSFHSEKPQGITTATFNHFIHEHGDPNTIAAADASGDFDAVMEENGGDDWLEGGLSQFKPIKLNEVSADTIDDVFSLVNINGKTRILYWGKSAIDPNVRVAEFWTEDELHRALRNKFVKIEKKMTQGDKTTIDAKRIPLSQWWLERRDRYTYDGLIFDSKAEHVSESDEINIWRGFAIEPVEGDWSLMDSHIRNVIASEESASADYIMRWLAWSVQNPTDPAETAIALSGGQGTGKGILGRAMCRIFGPHGFHASKPELLTGKFNAHFMQTSFLFSDEAIWPGHKQHEGALKALITEPTIPIEPKGVNAFTMPNCVKLFMASNAEWIVPAELDDRRFAVFGVDESRKQDRRYFGRIQRQLDNGGLSAMLFYFLNWDLQGWHPRNDIPQTGAKTRQQERTAPPELKWLAGYLESGVLDWQHPKRPNMVAASKFYEQARQSVQALRFWTDIDFARFLSKWGVTQKVSNGVWRVFPSLADLRAEWAKRNPGWSAFNSKVHEWTADCDRL